MLQFGQKGVAPIIVILLLLAGIGLGTYLVQQRTNILPFAHENSQRVCKKELQAFTLGYLGTSACSSQGVKNKDKKYSSVKFACADGFTSSIISDKCQPEAKFREQVNKICK